MVVHGSTLNLLQIEPGMLLADRYEVQERLGSGGVGIVFRVVDRDLNNQVVALKLLHPHLAQEEKVFARFRNEVLVARALTHPNIIRIHDIGKTANGFPYISMEFVDGYTLADRIAGRTTIPSIPKDPLTFKEGVALLYQIALGVGYAHEKGVVHRDLKPANVMLTAQGEVKLADFGMARILGTQTSLTQTGQALGTPDYMSPEQIRGEVTDARCDIYSLGIMAYELAVGRRPFEADSSVALAFKHLHEAIPDFSASATQIPKWYQDVVRKAAAKNKEDRFGTAFELAQALAQNMPEIVTQTGFYSIERTGFYQKGGDGADGKRTAAFELGISKGDSSGDKWEFGFDAKGGVTDTALHQSTATRVDEQRKITGLIWLASLAIVIVLLLLLPRMSSAVGRLVSKQVHAVELAFGLNLSLVSSLLGLEPIADTETKLALNDASGGVGNRAELEKELFKEEILGTAPLDTGSTSGAVTTAPEAEVVTSPDSGGASTNSAQPTESAVPGGVGVAVKEETGAANANVSKESAGVEEGAAAVVGQTAKIEEPSTAVPVVKEPTPMTELPANLTSTIIVQKTGESKPVDSLEINDLPRSKWIAAIEGVEGIEKEALKAGLLKQFTLQVIAPKDGKLVVELKPEIISLPSKDDSRAKIGSSFASLRAQGIEPGEFRLQMVRNGEPLVKKELFLYRAQVKLGPQIVEGGGKEEQIKIVRFPEGTALNGTTSGGASPVSTTPIIPPSTSGRTETATNTLPPARRPGDEAPATKVTSLPNLSVPVSTVAPTEPTSSPYPAEVPATTSYSGALELEGKKLNLSLAVAFSDSDISGTARIDEYGEFNVTGSVHPRGFEMILRSELHAISLVGSKTETALKGRFMIPAQNLRGPWQAMISR